MGFCFLAQLFSGRATLSIAAGRDASQSFAELLSKLLYFKTTDFGERAKGFSAPLALLAASTTLSVESRIDAFSTVATAGGDWKFGGAPTWILRPTQKQDDRVVQLLAHYATAILERLGQLVVPDVSLGEVSNGNTPPIRVVAGGREFIRPTISDHRAGPRRFAPITSMDEASLDAAEVDAFATAPLKSFIDIDHYVKVTSITGQGEPNVRDTLPFDLSEETDAQSDYAKEVLGRLEEDYKYHIRRENSRDEAYLAAVPPSAMADFDVACATAIGAGQSLPACPFVEAAARMLRRLHRELKGAARVETARFEAVTEEITTRANYIPDGASNGDSQQHWLRRFARRESPVLLESIIGALVSSRGVEVRLNAENENYRVCLTNAS